MAKKQKQNQKVAQPKNRLKTLINVKERHRALDEQISALQQVYRSCPTASRHDELVVLKAEKSRLKKLLTKLETVLHTSSLSADADDVQDLPTKNVVALESSVALPSQVPINERRVA